MTPAEFDRNTIIISSADNKINFRASGSVIKFDGFLKVYQVQETDEDVKNILPAIKVVEDRIVKENRWRILLYTFWPICIIKKDLVLSEYLK